MTIQATEVLLPSMGEGIAEATLVKWLKRPGEEVKKDEPLLEVSTDKVDTEIPSPISGKLLKTVAQAGATIEVNGILGFIGPEGAVIPEMTGAQALSKGVSSSSDSVKKSSSPERQTIKATATTAARNLEGASLLLKTSPLVRKMAKDHQIDLRNVAGTGLQGRITKEDVLAWLENPVLLQAPSTPEQPILGRVKTNTQNGVETLEGVPVKREKMTKMRRLIAEHMVESVRTSPHVTTTFEIDLHKVVVLREQHKASFQKKEGFNLTYTPFLIAAAVEAIKQHPIVNVSVDGDEVLWKDHINIGCAVALGSEGGGGLIVPVIKNAEQKSLTDICRSLNDLATRARSKKLLPDEVIGGTFSVTNPGGWGSVFSNPIINQPQVAMLGIGAIIKRPVVLQDETVVVRPMMFASLTFDHRVIDGEGGALWLASFKKILENWNITP